MTIEREIFSALIAQNAFQGEKPSVQSYAQLAVDKGFRALTSRQQAVVSPFLKKQCEGMRKSRKLQGMALRKLPECILKTRQHRKKSSPPEKL
jgi:hypothetical protein